MNDEFKDAPITLKSVGKCRVCGCDVIKKESRVFDPTKGAPIIGPGSLKQYMTVTGYHCCNCKLMYESPPPYLEVAPQQDPG